MQDLDTLFSQAISQERAARTRKAAAKRPVAPPATVKNLNDPEFWLHSRNVAVLHSETETLIGNFSEQLHTSLPGVKRFLRLDAPASISGTEYVSGNWWLEGTLITKRKSDFVPQNLILDLHLDALGLVSPQARIVAYISPDGGISRVDLSAETQFTPEHDGAAFTFLPANTNILPVLSHPCKLALRKELSL